MNKRTVLEPARRCAWCGRTKADGVRLLGPKVSPADPHICSECVVRMRIELFNAIDATALEEQYEAQLRKVEREVYEDIMSHIPPPKHMKEYLDSYVVGQEYAKRALSVAIYNHLKIRGDDTTRYGKVGKDKIDAKLLFPGRPEMAKGNILLIGPTGSGKTLLIQTLSRCVSLPFVTVDATTLTSTGYVGADVLSIIKQLYDRSHSKGEKRIEEVEHGIVYIDEIDKMVSKSDQFGVDINGGGVQNELLKMIEGTTVELPVKSGHFETRIKIDTSHILFIGGGAFPGLEKAIESRQDVGGIGFEADPKARKEVGSIRDVTPTDLIAYGFTPEFVGRFESVVTLDALTKEDLIEIMTEPKQAIVKEYQKMFQLDDCIIEFDDGALELIAEHALKKGTGARGLRALFERGLLEYMYVIPEINSETYLYVVPEMVREALHEVEKGEQDNDSVILLSELSKTAVRRL